MTVAADCKFMPSVRERALGYAPISGRSIWKRATRKPAACLEFANRDR